MNYGLRMRKKKNCNSICYCEMCITITLSLFCVSSSYFSRKKNKLYSLQQIYSKLNIFRMQNLTNSKGKVKPFFFSISEHFFIRTILLESLGNFSFLLPPSSTTPTYPIFLSGSLHSGKFSCFSSIPENEFLFNFKFFLSIECCCLT